MPGGQGGPRFPGFGVGRGFAIWGPFPVHAPDSAPETWTSLNKNLALHTALPVVDGFGGFVFTHGHFGFQKQRAAPVCMILMIFLEARPRAGAIKATPATDLMVFPAVPDHSRPQVRLALSCRPRLGFGSRGLVVRSLRHLPWGSRRQAMKFRRSAAGKSRCRTPLPSRGPELSPEWQAFWTMPFAAWFKRRSQLRGAWGRRPKGDAPRPEAGAGGSLAVSSPTPATPLLSLAKIRELNHDAFASLSYPTDRQVLRNPHVGRPGFLVSMSIHPRTAARPGRHAGLLLTPNCQSRSARSRHT